MFCAAVGVVIFCASGLCRLGESADGASIDTSELGGRSDAL
jgi:hypothetical protein